MAYVIMGTTGEWSVRQEWLVAVFLDKEKAEYWCQELQKEVDMWQRIRKSEYEDIPEGWSKLDKNMKCDYTGTNYEVIEVPIMF